MTFRNKSVHKAHHQQQSTIVEAQKLCDEIEQEVAAKIASGEMKEGSREHLEAKKVVRDTRNSIGLSKRRCP